MLLGVKLHRHVAVNWELSSVTSFSTECMTCQAVMRAF